MERQRSSTALKGKQGFAGSSKLLHWRIAKYRAISTVIAASNVQKYRPAASFSSSPHLPNVKLFLLADCDFDGVDQGAAEERLGEIRDAAGFECARTGRVVIVRGHEDDRDR